VAAWRTDPSTAQTTYGPIADWNTAAVTSMASLFYGQTTFNDDISKWNTASVSNMVQACALL
jgi:surface protein